MNTAELRELYRVPAGAKIIVVDGRHGRRFYHAPGDIDCSPRADGRYPAFEERAS